MRHLPNLISLGRLLAAPYILYLLWIGSFQTALIWFAAAGISDGVDGYLARHLKATSKLGAQLDPLGDKLLLSGSFLVLGLTEVIPTWLAGLVLGRDLIILLGVLLVLAFSSKSRQQLAFPPTQWGKWSTAAQIAFVLVVIGAAAEYPVGAVAAPLQWATVALTLVSGIDYARRGISMLRG